MSFRKIALGVFVLLLLVGTASAQYGSFGRNKVRDHELHWSILATEHFDVYYYPECGEFVGAVAEMAEAAWKKVSGRLDSEPMHRIPFILYASGRDFRQTNITTQFLPEGVGGFTEPLRNRVVIPFEGSQPRMWETTVHELTHVFTFYRFYRDVAGELLKTGIGVPDFWFMEGIADHVAGDWNTDGRMVLRDAVLSEGILPLELLRYGEMIPGWAMYLTYKQGQSALDFFVDHYGEEKLPELLDAIAAIPERSVSDALEEVIGADLNDFTDEWLTDLKRRYWVDLIEGRRPEDFCHRLTRLDEEYTSYLSPVFSPSAELVAVYSNLGEKAGIYLIDAEEGEVFDKLADAGEYDYLQVGQRTLAFAPDGDSIAFIAKEGGWLGVYLVDVLNGNLYRDFELNFDALRSITYAPDGESVYLAAQQGGQLDLFQLRLTDGHLTQLTDTPHMEQQPAASPDGRYLAFSLEEEDGTHIAELTLATGDITTLTSGAVEDRYPVYTPDGEAIVFSSDRQGPSNLYQLNRADGGLIKLTDSLRDIFNPCVSADGEKIVFNAYQGMTYQVYSLDLEDSLAEEYDSSADELVFSAPELPIRSGVEVGELDKLGQLLPWFYDLKIDGAMAQASYTTDGVFEALGYVTASDTLGDHRLIAQFGLVSISSLDDLDLDVGYYWMKNRSTLGGRVFTWKDYYLTSDGYSWQRNTGGQLSYSYPFSETFRFEASAIGYEQAWQHTFNDGTTQDDSQFIFGPMVSLVFDNTEWSYYHPLRGVRANLSYFRPTKAIGSDWEFNGLALDFRGYLKLLGTSSLATRIYSSHSFGGDPTDNFEYLGGASDLRGFGYTEFVGNNVSFLNMELRLPLIDRIDIGFLPGFIIGDIRGIGFMDLGMAWDNDAPVSVFSEEPYWHFDDLKGSLGVGIRWASLGLPIRLDWAWPWDGRDFKDAVFHFTLGWEF